MNFSAELTAWLTGTDTYAAALVAELLPKGINRHPALEQRVAYQRVLLALATRDRNGHQRGQPFTPEEADEALRQLYGS